MQGPALPLPHQTDYGAHSSLPETGSSNNVNHKHLLTWSTWTAGKQSWAWFAAIEASQAWYLHSIVWSILRPFHMCIAMHCNASLPFIAPLILSCSEALDASKCSRMCAFSAFIRKLLNKYHECRRTAWNLFSYVLIVLFDCYLVLFVPVVSTVQKIWRTNRQQFHWVRQWRIRSMHQKHCRIQLGAGGMDRDGYVRIVWRYLKVSDLTRSFSRWHIEVKTCCLWWSQLRVCLLTIQQCCNCKSIRTGNDHRHLELWEGHLLEHWF